MADGKVVIDTALNNKGFTTGIKNLSGGLGGLKSVLGGIGKAVGVAFGVAALVKFGKEAIELGSNVAEVQNVVDVAFGDMAYKIEDFAKTSIRNFGMSKLAAKKTASTYMAMAKGMGMADENASNMAISLTGLSGDVASFFNISQELADTKLKSVFTGETETLKDLGVVMTQANLKAYALSQGISKDIDKMTQAELVSLRYGFVTKQLSLAQGDFARTSDSWANQTRILSEQWKEFMSIAGQALITVLRPLVVTLNSIVSVLIDAANVINNVVTAMFGGASTQMQQTQQDAGSVGDAIGDSVDDQDNLTDAVKDTNKAAKKSLAAFDEINKLTGDAAGTGSVETPIIPPAGGIVGDEGEKVEGLSEKMTAMLESLRNGFRELKGWVTDFFAPFKESWDVKGAFVIDAVKTEINKISELLRSIGTTFMNVWSDNTGVTILSTIYDIIAEVHKIVGTLAERFRLAWEANGNGEAIWRAILGIIQSVVSFVDHLATATLDWAKSLNLEPIIGAFRRFLEALKPVVDIILDGLAWAYKYILLPLSKWVIEEAAPAALDLFSAALDALSAVIEALKPFAMWLWETFLKPIGEWTGAIIINAIKWLTDRLNEFAAWARENPEVIQKIAEVILSFLAGVLAYETVHKISSVIGSIKAAFEKLATGFRAINPQALMAAFAFAAIFYAIMQVAKCWDQMEGWQRVISILGIVAAAAAAAALAFGILHTTMSMGIAVGAIIAGIAAVTIAIGAAQSKIKATSTPSFSGGGSYGGSFGGGGTRSASVPRLAKGAVIPANREFLAVLGDQKSGTNIEAPLSTIKQGLREVMAEGGGNPSEVRLIVTAAPGLARNFKFAIDRETERQGVRLVEGVN